MRRVYDDSTFEVYAKALENAFCEIPADTVSEYDYGMYRAKVSKIKQSLLIRVANIKFGNTNHAYGIRNNNAIEIIYTGRKDEEQICGLLHLTNDMFGNVLFFVTDIDEERRTPTYKMWGCDKKNPNDMRLRRYAQPYSRN